MPLITAFRWDTGVQVHAGAARLSGSAAVTNGTVSDPHGKDNNGGKQISGRVQWQPVVGLVLGASGGARPVSCGQRAKSAWAQGVLERARARVRRRIFPRPLAGARRRRLESLGGAHAVRAADAASAFVEGTYKVRPGVFVAARADKLTFSDVTGSSQTRTWDAPVTRVEAGLGVYVRRNLLARGTYQHNWRDGGLIRNRRQFTVQLQFWL